MRTKYSRTFAIPTAIILTLTLVSVVPISEARAQDCTATACISVFIENGKIVIEGRKEAAPVVKARPRLTRSPRPAPIASAKPLVRPSAHSRVSHRALVRKRAPAPVIRKVVASASLNDRLIKLLPMANISKQPDTGEVLGVPIIFWCDLPSVFNSKVSIIGELVDVTMRPAFFWSFGDGSILMTTESGAPYPSEEIAHKYSRAGVYSVVLVSIWGGSWVHNGITRAITGTIRKISFANVKIAPAPTVVLR